MSCPGKSSAFSFPRFDTIHHMNAAITPDHQKHLYVSSFQSPKWVLCQLIQPLASCLVSEKKTSHQDKSSYKPTILWLMLLIQCNNVLKSLTSRNGLDRATKSDCGFSAKKTPRDASLIITAAEDWGRPVHVDSVYHRHYFSVCLLSFRSQCESLWKQLPTQSWCCGRPLVIMACQSLQLL